MKRITLILAVVLGVVALAFVAVKANATDGGDHPQEGDCDDPTITVVVEEAWDEVIPGTPGQHYSWTGGKRDTDDPPTEVPPSDNWQANTSQEPHTNGGGNPATWVNDSLHYTAASEHHASWFYYTQPVPEQVIHHPEVTEEQPNPDYPCPTEPPTPTDPPTTEPPTEEPPTEEPPSTDTPDEPDTPSTDVPAERTKGKCVGTTWMSQTQQYIDGEWVNTGSSVINGAKRCAPEPGEPTPVIQEEGM